MVFIIFRDQDQISLHNGVCSKVSYQRFAAHAYRQSTLLCRNADRSVDPLLPTYERASPRFFRI